MFDIYHRTERNKGVLHYRAKRKRTEWKRKTLRTARFSSLFLCFSLSLSSVFFIHYVCAHSTSKKKPWQQPTTAYNSHRTHFKVVVCGFPSSKLLFERFLADSLWIARRMASFYVLIFLFTCVIYVHPQKFEGLSRTKPCILTLLYRLFVSCSFRRKYLHETSLVGYQCYSGRKRKEMTGVIQWFSSSSGNRIRWISWRKFSTRNWNMPMRERVWRVNRCKNVRLKARCLDSCLSS